ncbi:MAG TPA: hypothetical protein VH374_20375 [Polyangia bacterium]|nr:hypothetical protein [Polyangia bacterium]
MTETADAGAGAAVAAVPDDLAARLRDPATPDQIVAVWAALVDAAGATLIAEASTRFLRTPAIVTQLYANPRAPMAALNQAIAACARAAIKVDGIPAFDDVAQAVAADPEAIDAARADGSFGAALAHAADEEAVARLPPAEAAKKRKSPIIDFTKLKLYEKIRLATLGNAYCRQTLLRDANKMVSMAAIRSPGITDAEVVRAAGNRAVSEEVIRYIASSRDYVKLYPVKLSLVQNPKCPLAMSLKLLPLLHAEDLKNVAKSRNVPSALSTAARKLAAAREAK